VGRHYLQNEAEAEKDPPAPPTGLGQEVARLPNSDERIRRRAGAAEICGQSGAFSRLQQNGQRQDDAVDDQQCQKKRVNH